MDIFPPKRPGPIAVRRRPNILAVLFLRLWIWGGIGLAVPTGCAAVGSDYVRPELKAPDQWRHGTGQAHPQNLRLLSEWWQIFDDPVLTRLIHQASAGNLDLREALSRVREARFQHRKNRSSLFPTVEASGAARKSGSGGENGDTTESELYVAEFDASWELDLFGGVRRSIEATHADIQAQVEDLNDVMVTLLAGVAVNYIDLRTYQTRLAVALHNVDAQKETLELLEALSRAGMGDDLAAAQARYNLEGSRAKVPDLTVSIETAHTRDLTNSKLPALDVLEQTEADRAAAVAAATASLQAPVLYTLSEDLRHMELQVDVDEADVGSVKVCQAAIFTVDAYPEHTFKAQITQVRYGADATDGVVTYKTVLSVDNPDLLLRPGMTATANIIVLETKDSLLVPNAALRFSPSKPAAGRRRNGGLLDSLLPRPRPPRGPAGAHQGHEFSLADAQIDLVLGPRGRLALHLSLDQRAVLRREFIGFVFQGFNLLNRTSALENVELPLIYRNQPGRARHIRAIEALAAVGLEKWAHHTPENHTPGELSGGQQQRVAIARAIVGNPRVFLADEPTGNLDSIRSKEIMQMLLSFNRQQDVTIVMVTHEADMAAYAGRQIHFQ